MRRLMPRLVKLSTTSGRTALDLFVVTPLSTLMTVIL